MNKVLLRGIDRLHTELTEKGVGYAYKANAVFNREFARVFQKTPSEYRRGLRASVGT